MSNFMFRLSNVKVLDKKIIFPSKTNKKGNMEKKVVFGFQKINSVLE